MVWTNHGYAIAHQSIRDYLAAAHMCRGIPRGLHRATRALPGDLAIWEWLGYNGWPWRMTSGQFGPAERLVPERCVAAAGYRRWL